MTSTIARILVFFLCVGCGPSVKRVVVEDDDIYEVDDEGARTLVGKTTEKNFLFDVSSVYDLEITGVPTSLKAFDDLAFISDLDFSFVGFRRDERGRPRRVPGFVDWRIPDGSFPELRDIRFLHAPSHVTVSTMPELRYIFRITALSRIEPQPNLGYVDEAEVESRDLRGLESPSRGKQAHYQTAPHRGSRSPAVSSPS